MSLVEEFHLAHKQRLARMMPRPPQPPQIVTTDIAEDEVAAGPAPPIENTQLGDAWALLSKETGIDMFGTVTRIQGIVAKRFGVKRSDLLSRRRTANIVLPRQVAMYLAKELTLQSLPEIGRRFGNRDHTTVLHAVRKIKRALEYDGYLAERVHYVRQQFEEPET